MKNKLKSVLVACFCLVLIVVAVALGFVFGLKPNHKNEPKKTEPFINQKTDSTKSIKKEKEQQQEKKEDNVEPPVYINVPIKSIDTNQKQADKQVIKQQAPTPKDHDEKIFNPHLIKEDIVNVRKENSKIINKDITYINQKPTIKQLLYNQNDLAAGVDLIIEVNTKDAFDNKVYLELIDDNNMVYKSLLQKPQNKTNKLIFEFKNLNKKRYYKVHKIMVYDINKNEFINQQLNTADQEIINLRETKVINLTTKLNFKTNHRVTNKSDENEELSKQENKKINKQDEIDNIKAQRDLTNQYQEQEQKEDTYSSNKSINHTIKSEQEDNNESDNIDHKIKIENNQPIINPFDKQINPIKKEVEIIKTIPIKRFNLVNSLNNNPILYELIDWAKYFNSGNGKIVFDQQKFNNKIKTIMSSIVLSYPEFKHLSKHLRVNIKYRFSDDLKSIIIITNWYLDNYNLENEQRFYDEIVIELGS